MINKHSSIRKNSYKTAITRKKFSAPMKWLMYEDLLDPGFHLDLLDYGCGKGWDAMMLGMSKYDPHFFPTKPDGEYGIITCNYVINTMASSFDRMNLILDIQNLLTDDGIAYITIRADKRNLNGITKTGSWQGFTPLNLPVVHKTSGYIIYELRKLDGLGNIFIDPCHSALVVDVFSGGL